HGDNEVVQVHGALLRSMATVPEGSKRLGLGRLHFAERVGNCTAIPLADHRWLTSSRPASHTSFASHVAQARTEVRYALLPRRARFGALLSGRASAVAATPPKRR